MDLGEYHARNFPRLQNAFQFAPYVLGYGKNLINYGWNPDGLLVQVEHIDKLWELAVKRGLEVFVPILGRENNRENSGKWMVLCPGDVEVGLWERTKDIYESPQKMFEFLNNFIKPNLAYLENMFQGVGCPYDADMTPSGFHFLFRAKEGTAAAKALEEIGWVETELLQAYKHEDPNDIKRHNSVPLHIAKVYSGMGVFFTYLGLKMKAAELSELEVALSDSIQGVIDDISWTWMAAYMRIIRSMFTGHGKNQEKHNKYWQPILATVMKTQFDGKDITTCDDWPHMVSCMWDMEKALEHHSAFSGYIPIANDGLVALIEGYKRTQLHELDREFFDSPMWQPGEALDYARSHARSYSTETRSALRSPNPNMRTPSVVKRFIEDVFHGAPPHGGSHGEKLRFVASVLRDGYLEPESWSGWDRWKEPPAAIAAGMARTIGADVAFENGIIHINP